MANMYLFLLPEDIGDLFGAPILFQQPDHQSELFFRESGSPVGSPSSGNGITMGHFRAINMITGLAVSS
jgi:hypothetical protein